MDSLIIVGSLETSQRGDLEEPRSSVDQPKIALVADGIDESCITMEMAAIWSLAL